MVTGARDTVVDGHRVRVVPLGLACCAVEVADGLPLLPPAASAEGGAGVGPYLAGAADVHVLVVAGTVTPALVGDVRETWARLPEPRAAVAYGVCTISGGPYWDSYAVLPGLGDILPGYVAVSGCPPPPAALESAVAEAARSALGVGAVTPGIGAIDDEAAEVGGASPEAGG